MSDTNKDQIIVLPSGRRLSTRIFDRVTLVKSFVHGGIDMELWEIKVERDEHIFRSLHASLEEAELSVIAFCYFIEKFAIGHKPNKPNEL